MSASTSYRVRNVGTVYNVYEDNVCVMKGFPTISMALHGIWTHSGSNDDEFFTCESDGKVNLKLDYTKLCLKCCFFDHKDGTCDMCSCGFPHSIDNNGKKPEEVDSCNCYTSC